MNPQVCSNSKKSIRVVVIISLAALFLSGCGIADSLDQAVTVLDEAIDALASESANWRRIVEAIKDELPSDLREEVDSALNRAVAASGVEFRCDVDFVRKRIRKDLIDIRARYTGERVGTKIPAICHALPSVVEPAGTQYVEFFGYDFDKSQIQLYLENGSQTVDVSHVLDRPTHYLLTLNMSQISLTQDSSRFILRGGDQEFTVGILKSPTTRRARVTVNVHEIHVINGGGECEAEVYFEIDINGVKDPSPWGKGAVDQDRSTIPDCGYTITNFNRQLSVDVSEEQALTIGIDMYEKDGIPRISSYHQVTFVGSREWAAPLGIMRKRSESPGGEFGDGVFEVTYSLNVEWLN